MNTDTLDMLLRLRYWSEDVSTFDVSRITFKYLLNHASCEKNHNFKPNEVELPAIETDENGSRHEH